MLGTQGPWPPNRVTASMTDPNGGDVSISALVLTLLIPGLIGLGHSPGPWHWAEPAAKCKSPPGPLLSDLISLIPGVPGTPSGGEFSAGCAITEHPKAHQNALKTTQNSGTNYKEKRKEMHSEKKRDELPDFM